MFTVHTKASTVHGRPRPKDVECFQNRSVHEHYERSTMSEYFWVTLLIIKNYTISSELSTELFSVSLQPIHEYHQVFRHDHEPCRIHIELWNVLFTNVFMQLYPNHLNCTVIGTLENKKIQQSLPLHAPRNLIIVYIMMLKHSQELVCICHCFHVM